MLNQKLKINIFIIMMTLMLISIPRFDGNQLTLENSGNPNNQVSSIMTNQVGQLEKLDLNASIVQVTRNITIKPTSRIVIEDQIELQIHDNITKISIFNYTLPTMFDKYVQSVKIWSKTDTSVAIRADENLRTFKKFVGINATTYYFDIRQDDIPVNNSNEGVFISVKMEAIGAITFSSFQEDQKGVFTSPIRPIFPNLKLENSFVSIKLDAAQDVFSLDNITKVFYGDREWPVKGDANGKVIVWQNMTRPGFDELSGLEFGTDYADITFTSSTSAPGETKSSTIPFVFTNVKRNLRIDPWGFVFVKETMTILHKGAPRLVDSSTYRRDYEIGGVNVLIDAKAKLTDVSDKLGPLNTNFREESTFYPRTTLAPNEDKLIFTVNFRNTIYGAETYTFSIEYQFNSTDLITKSGSDYTLNATLLSDYNTTIYNLESVFELPAGAKLQSQNFKSRARNSVVDVKTEVGRDTFSFFRHLKLIYTIENASYVDNNQFEITYSYSGLGHFQYVITFSLFIFIILLGFVALSRVEISTVSPSAIITDSIPVNEIDSFFSLFSERSGAHKRLAELNERRKKGKISKKDYDGQTKAIQRRIRDINPSLEKVASALAKSGGKYERLVDKIMLASQRKRDIRSNAESARRNYLKGDTPKDIYQKLMRAYTKDLNKQESTINRSLSEMLELVNAYN